MTGRIFSYVHFGRVGVLLELSCDSHRTLREVAFEDLGKNLCLQIAATSPRFVSEDDLPAELAARQYRQFLEEASKPRVPQWNPRWLARRQLRQWIADRCLMAQSSIKDPDITVGELLLAFERAHGDQVRVRRFVRFAPGKW